MVNISLLHEQLAAAGLPVCSVGENGLVQYTRLLNSAEQATATAVIAAHNPAGLSQNEQAEQDARQAKTDFRNLPDWATWTPQQGREYVIGAVLSGWDQATTEAWIESNVTTLANAKTALKLLANAILSMRALLAVLAMAILYLREIAVRRQG